MTETQDPVLVDHNALVDFAEAALKAAGLRQNEASTVAEILVDADLRGIDTHGVLKIPEYTTRLENGGMNPAPDITAVETRPGTRIVDGDDGPGQAVALKGMREAIEAASEAGCGFVSVVNSNHFGAASYFTNYAADRGYIGLCMTHAGQNVVPYGGIEPYFGTNPIAISVPREGPNVSVDMSTSWKSKSMITLAEERGEEIPEEWALDASGQPTTDPSAVHGLRPVGGPKGYGLAFIVEVLCGVLGGTVFGDDVPSSYEGLDTPQKLAHFMGAIQVDAFAEYAAYERRIETMINELREIPTTDGIERVLFPGEPEARTKQEFKENGIPFQRDDWKKLSELDNKYQIGIDPVN